MTEKSADPQMTRRAWMRPSALGCASALTVLALICAFVLELRFSGLSTERILIDQTPVTLYRLSDSAPLPPVVIAHGFGGSRQMMDQIAVSLARQGFHVASVDLPGHGRNGTKLSPDISTLDGTTAQLVEVIERVAMAISDRSDTDGPISFVGHSMATDVVIRAAQSHPDVGAVVAISMYSPAVTQTAPTALLILSGATESHLRMAGLNAVRLLDPSATEGKTVTRDGTIRRTAVAPLVGHVGVLYAPKSLHETTSWIRNTLERGSQARLDWTGWVAGVLLCALVFVVWPLSKLIPARTPAPSQHVKPRTFLACLLLPIPAAIAIGALPVFGISGNAAFGTLGLILGVWGMIQLAVLYRSGARPGRPDLVGAALYLGFALVFALALDRYGASFVPAGERAIVMAGLLLGTLPLMIADTMLTQRASILRRILARLSLLIALSGAMALAPSDLGLAFTTVPVLVLFFLVYGTMARWIVKRRGPQSVSIAKGVVLAWAFAASTPLFATAIAG
ncbi:MAG: alpha/beta fold hydrolase [Pseudomonadota bacterium]